MKDRKPGSSRAFDLALVRNPALAFRLSPAVIDALDDTSRSIVELIRAYPWLSTHDSVAAAALFGIGIPDEFIEYIIELELEHREIAA